VPVVLAFTVAGMTVAPPPPSLARWPRVRWSRSPSFAACPYWLARPAVEARPEPQACEHIRS
jgi:hypothetical protein